MTYAELLTLQVGSRGVPHYDSFQTSIDAKLYSAGLYQLAIIILFLTCAYSTDVCPIEVLRWVGSAYQSVLARAEDSVLSAARFAECTGADPAASARIRQQFCVGTLLLHPCYVFALSYIAKRAMRRLLRANILYLQLHCKICDQQYVDNSAKRRHLASYNRRERRWEPCFYGLYLAERFLRPLVQAHVLWPRIRTRTRSPGQREQHVQSTKNHAPRPCARAVRSLAHV